MNNLWDVVFSQESGQEGLRCLGVAAPLKENVEHSFMLVYCPPAAKRRHRRFSGQE